MNEIKFAERHKKLENSYFSTIRDEKKGENGEPFEMVIDGKEVGKVILMDITPIHVCNCTEKFLEYDTDTGGREEALESLKKHYPDLTENSVIWIHYFVWVSSKKMQKYKEGRCI